MTEQVLSTWRQGTAKEAIIGFVTRTSGQGHSPAVPIAERVAVFDNDGTLWCEKPMEPGSARRGPYQSPCRVRDHLHVDAMASVFSGVVRLLVVDAVDRDQGAVEDRVRQQADPGHGCGQVLGGGRQQGDRFADV